MRDDESSGSDYASESEEEIDEREFTCENVRVRARARGTVSYTHLTLPTKRIV